MSAETTWLTELLEALERHTQALQANAAAVRSLESWLVQWRTETCTREPVPPDVRGDIEEVLHDLVEQLARGRELAERLAGLRSVAESGTGRRASEGDF